VKLGLAEKLAAFCGELGDVTLAEIVEQYALGAVFDRVKAAIRAGNAPADLEADLDYLNRAVHDSTGLEIYPDASRGFQPLVGGGPGSGVRWWSCPAGLCAGRGRVRPRQETPICEASGAALDARPVTW
jgi:hypothetical protein